MRNRFVKSKKLCPDTKVEALTPDFQGREDCIELLFSKWCRCIRTKC